MGKPITYPNHKWATLGTTISKCVQCGCIRQSIPMMDGNVHSDEMANKRKRVAFRYKLGANAPQITAPPCVAKPK